MQALRRLFCELVLLLLILPQVWGQEEFLCPTDTFPNATERFVNVSLTLKILLVEFQDVRHRTDPFPYAVADFQNMLVSSGRYVSLVSYTPDAEEVYGSLRDYFNKMSSGNVTLDGYVVNRQRFGIPTWVILPHTKDYYHSFPYFASPIFSDAITAANAQGLDVSTSSTVKLAIIYAGNVHLPRWPDHPQNCGLNPMAGGNMYIMSERQDWPYNQENAGDKFSRIGIHCHEFAHLLGIGHSSASRADVMEAGYRNGPDHRGAAPAPINPAWRALKGWLSPLVINGQQQFDVYYSLTASQVFRINSNNNNDYFLIENRRFDQEMTIGTTTVPDYNNIAFFPPAWPHGTITQGIFVWRVRGGTPYDYSDNGLLYASGRWGQTWPEGIPSETDDGVPFPGIRNVRVLSPWSEPRNPTPNQPPNSGIFVPNTKYGTNVGMEVLSENQAQGYFTVMLYQVNPENASPSKPQDFRVSVYNTGDNAHPRLTWASNIEPDLSGYEIWRRTGYPTGMEPWTLLTSVSSSTSQYIDYSINYAGSGGFIARYKIRAKDTQNKLSVFSDSGQVQYGNAWKTAYERVPEVFKLYQNVPNPFNPTTVIQYQLPVDIHVTLKVYDVLGREVRTLVNEYREAGQYKVDFNAADLPSGIYFYRMSAGSFHDTKKMGIIR